MANVKEHAYGRLQEELSKAQEVRGREGTENRCQTMVNVKEHAYGRLQEELSKAKEVRGREPWLTSRSMLMAGYGRNCQRLRR